MMKKIFFAYICLTLFQSCKNEMQERQKELNKSYLDVKLGRLHDNSHTFDKKFYETINAQFLLDSVANKNQEEFILVYHNSDWRDTINSNFTTKIVYNKIKNQWTYHRIDYITYATPLKSIRFKKELKSNAKVGINYVYYKEVNTGILNNRTITFFLSDSLYTYRNRYIGYSSASGFRPIGHFKWINDTLKYREYDLRYNFDEESIRLKKLLNLIKEETSK